MRTKKRRERLLTGGEDTRKKAEMERKKNKMKEREKMRIWVLAWSNQMRILILGDTSLIVNWMNGKWKIDDQKFRTMVQKMQNMLDRTDIRPMGEHLDVFQHVHREWNQEADHLTHVAREKGTTWNSYLMDEGARVEAVRSFFDGGAHIQCDDKIKNKVGSAFVIQIPERIEESTEKMKWKTIVEVTKALPDDATITQAECTAAVQAARAICCLARTGCICFDLDGNLIEDCSRNRAKTRNKMEEDVEGRWKKEEEKISRLSHCFFVVFFT